MLWAAAAPLFAVVALDHLIQYRLLVVILIVILMVVVVVSSYFRTILINASMKWLRIPLPEVQSRIFDFPFFQISPLLFFFSSLHVEKHDREYSALSFSCTSKKKMSFVFILRFLFLFLMIQCGPRWVGAGGGGGGKGWRSAFPNRMKTKQLFFLSLSKFHVVSERNGAGQRNQQRRLELYFSRHADRNRDTQDTAENWFFSYFILFLSWDFLVSLKIFRGLIPSKRISFFKRNFLQVLLGFVLTSPRFHVIAMMIILKLALFICSSCIFGSWWRELAGGKRRESAA